MHTGTLGTFHTAAFIQELSLWVKGIKTKTQPCHHHDSSRSHRSPGAVICSGLFAESSKDSFYDADLSVCKVREWGGLFISTLVMKQQGKEFCSRPSRKEAMSLG